MDIIFRFKHGILALILIIVVVFSSCSNKTSSIDIEKKAKNNVYLEDENVGGLKSNEIIKKIKNYANKVNQDPKDAKFDNDKWEVVQLESPGKRVDIQDTLNKVLNSKDGEKVNVSVKDISPKVVANDVNKNIKLIGKFTTKLLDKHDSRINNIEIACKNINSKVLAPGEEFSFNSMLGVRTKDKGYEVAAIIIKTENGYQKGYGVGGGICQVSTTLFNAARKANLQITERHIHTKEVGYVPLGEDATVSYNEKDLKFKNNKTHQIMLKLNISGEFLNSTIYENTNLQ